jgi:hypothetical protein
MADRTVLGTSPFLLCALLGCEPEAPPARVDPPDAGDVPAPSARPDVGGSGALPVDFPVIEPRSAKGEFALAPSRSWLDEAVLAGVERQPFLFYGAWVAEPGAKETLLDSLSGQRSRIPNALVVPIRRGERAEPGDLVLTAWASGAGMQRAIVVAGGTAEQPLVRYLDLDLDGPSGWGTKEDRLTANTFSVLRQPGEPGTTVACRQGARFTRWILLAERDQKLLGVGFAGKLAARPLSECKKLPLGIELKPRDSVWAPVLGAYTRAWVARSDKAIGRIWAKHEAGGVEVEQAFSVLDVARDL